MANLVSFLLGFFTLVILMRVGCDGAIGGTKVDDRCGVCGGDESTCHIISGIFTRRKLPYGYNKVTTIPVGACHINITEMAPSSNYLALMLTHGGYIFNGNWALGYSNDYKGAGTVFQYHRAIPGDTRDAKEFIRSKGPTNESIDLMLLKQEDNKGVLYSYTIPMDKYHYTEGNTHPDHEQEVTERDQPQYISKEDYTAALRQNGDEKRNPDQDRSDDISNQPQQDDTRRSDRYSAYIERLRRQRQRAQDNRRRETATSKDSNSDSAGSVVDQLARRDYGQHSSRNTKQNPQNRDPNARDPNAIVPNPPEAPTQSPSRLQQARDAEYQARMDAYRKQQAEYNKRLQQQQQQQGSNSQSGTQSQARAPSNSQYGGATNQQQSSVSQRGYGSTQQGGVSSQQVLPQPGVNYGARNPQPQPGVNYGARNPQPQPGINYGVRNPGQPQAGINYGAQNPSGQGRQIQPKPGVNYGVQNHGGYPGSYGVPQTGYNPVGVNPPQSPYYPQRHPGYAPIGSGQPYPGQSGQPYPRQSGQPYPGQTYMNQQPVYVPAVQPGSQGYTLGSVDPYKQAYYGSRGSPRGPVNDQIALSLPDVPRPQIGTLNPDADYSWKITGFTDCTRECGEGSQTTIIVCVKVSSQAIVTDDNCDNNIKPALQSVKCNTFTCPPVWETGEWGECSTSCDPGEQTRTVDCMQRVSSQLSLTVSPFRCTTPRPIPTQACNSDKPCIHWQLGDWTKCSVDCGRGQRSREVVCVNGEDKMIAENGCTTTKPSSTEICDMGSCAKTWFFSEWSQECSSECGQGVYTRETYCSAEPKRCASLKKPHIEKACHSEIPCGGVWFEGPWGKCGVTCGAGVAKRDVACIKKLGRLMAIVGEENCQDEERPISEQPCQKPACKPQWFMTHWTECTKTCGTGFSTREVKCLNEKKEPTSSCVANEKPEHRKPCNTLACPAQTPDAQCKDKFNHCRLVVQARLCRFDYYKDLCCLSCTSHAHHHHHDDT